MIGLLLVSAAIDIRPFDSLVSRDPARFLPDPTDLTIELLSFGTV